MTGDGNGMEWNGNGMEWNGNEWNGMEWKWNRMEVEWKWNRMEMEWNGTGMAFRAFLARTLYTHMWYPCDFAQLQSCQV